MRLWLGITVSVLATNCFALTFFHAGDASPSSEWFTQNGPTLQNFYYEKFELLQQVQVTALHSDQWITSPQGSQVGVQFQIRQGMGPLNGGQIVASGFGTASAVPLGFQVANVDVKRITLTGLSVVLDPGTYWMTLSLYNADGAILTTDGANGVGPTVGDHTSIKYDFFSGQTYYVLNKDFSYGVEGFIVPEPLCAITLVLGVVGLAQSRRARSAKQR